MSRRLGVGERGDVFYNMDERGQVVAMLYFRDHTGRRRRRKAVGPSKIAAGRAVSASVDEALAAGGGIFTVATTFDVPAQQWLAGVEAMVVRGVRSPTTLDVYRRMLRVHVLPGLGRLRLGELSPGRIDRFLTELHRQQGYSVAKMCRTVVSGVCSLLVRGDALRSNPVRDVARLEQGRGHVARALSAGDVEAWLRVLDANDHARRKDLPDLVRFLLGTGVRLGEALALTWKDVDLQAGFVVVEWTVVRVVGQGLVRKSTKAIASERTLVQPTWCVELLRRRRSKAATLVGPVFPSSTGGWRDRNNVSRDLRQARAGTSFEWFVSHTARRTVATLLDGQGLSARAIADQLGHARVSMTQDVYMGRRIVGQAAARSLDTLLPSEAAQR